jgi:HEPN domain-containing protein
MERYESWISRAKSSYELSKAIVSNDIYFEDLCYQAQQAVEKAFKGLLIYFGVEPEFTHNIGVLIKELGKYTEINDKIREGMQLTNYAVQTRYPGTYSEISKEEYEKAIIIVKNCLDWVNEIINIKENEKVDIKAKNQRITNG